MPARVIVTLLQNGGSMIKQEEGEHFDPAVVEAFLTCRDAFLRVHSPAETGERALASAATSGDRYRWPAVPMPLRRTDGEQRGVTEWQ